MTSETARSQEPPRITFTEAATAKLTEVIDNYPRPVAGLRLQIVGRGPEGLQHVLSIVERGAEPAEDATATVEGLPVPVYVEGRNLPYLRDVTVNYRYKGPNISGLEFENPAPVWLDPLALRVQQVFDTQINPAIAAHGGFVQLLDVNDGVAYVQLGGGCQGCGMADVTLKQGIAVAVKEAVPEIREVVDSTDHASGTNPYFKPAKK
ncbi:MAG TPA: NifU family protein [Dehalococcoidia bacterium]|jgi:Fe/S biogenesis protein NfuA